MKKKTTRQFEDPVTGGQFARGWRRTRRRAARAGDWFGLTVLAGLLIAASLVILAINFHMGIVFSACCAAFLHHRIGLIRDAHAWQRRIEGDCQVDRPWNGDGNDV